MLMNKMNQKKLYIWKLADFLCQHDMRMSGEELASHLNRNNFMTSYDSKYEGGRGYLQTHQRNMEVGS